MTLNERVRKVNGVPVWPWRLLLLTLCLSTVLSLILLIAGTLLAFEPDRTYDFVNPLYKFWTATITLVFSTIFLVWWIWATKQRALDLYFLASSSTLLFLAGFISMISLGASGYSVESGWSILWVVTTGANSIMLALFLRNYHSTDTSEQPRPSNWQESDGETPSSSYSSVRRSSPSSSGEAGSAESDAETENAKAKRPCPRKASCCCSCCLLVTLCIFALPIAVQSAREAMDFALYPADGQVLRVTVPGFEDYPHQIHITCQGSAAPGASTLVLLHGGGSNSVSMQPLATQLSDVHGRRACTLDAPGYGWTPTYYTTSNGSTLPAWGALVAATLVAASETGPFACAGHSAGATACLELALAAPALVTGLAFLDGYPDAVRPSNVNFGGSGSSPIALSQGAALLAGPTGFLRSLVGNPGDEFAAPELKSRLIAGYGQARFWFSQYWDVARDVGAGESGYLYPRLNGSMAPSGLVSYGRSLACPVFHLPAWSTANASCYEAGTGLNGSLPIIVAVPPADTNCSERLLYWRQAHLYVAGLSPPGTGAVVEAPDGSEHSYPYELPYYEWAAAQLNDRL